MARRETAQIIIQIRGAAKAALEAREVADGMDGLGDQTDQAGRAADRATVELSLMERQLKKLARAELVAGGGMFPVISGMTVMTAVAVPLASVILPALAVALGQVTAAAGLWSIGLLGGLAALVAASGLMALAVITRFRRLRDVAGTAAARLADKVVMLKETFLDIAAPGADKLMSGLAAGISAITPLVGTLRSQFTSIGGALGDVFRQLGLTFAGMGPEVRAMLAQVPGAIQALGEFGDRALKLLVQLSTVGLPVVAHALQTVAGWMDHLTASLHGGGLDKATATLRRFGQVVSTFWDGLATPLHGIIGPAVTEAGQSLIRLARPIGTVIGTLLAGLMQAGRTLLPLVVTGVRGLADLLTQVAPALQGLGTGSAGHALVTAFTAITGAVKAVIPGVLRFGKSVIAALAPAMPFVHNVILPLAKGVGEGLLAAFKAIIPVLRITASVLGWIGQKATPLSGILEGVGKVVGFVLAGPILGGVSKVIGGIERLGPAAQLALQLFVLPFREGVQLLTPIIGGFVRLFDMVKRAVSSVLNWVGANWPLLVGLLGGPLGLAIEQVITHFNGIVKFISGLGSKIAHAATGMWDGIKTAFRSAINWILSKWNSLHFSLGGWKIHGPGPLPDFTIPKLTVGMPHVPLLATGGLVSGVGSFITGDAGPELNTLLPGGRVRVDPLTPAKPVMVGGGGGLVAEGNIVVPLHIDGRRVAEAVDRVRLNVRSRR